MKVLISLAICSLFAATAVGQSTRVEMPDPVPGEQEEAAEQQPPLSSTAQYFGGYPEEATANDREYIDGLRQELRRTPLRKVGPLRRLTINRMLSHDLEFVKEVKVNSAREASKVSPELIGDDGLVLWAKLTPEQWAMILDILLRFIQVFFDSWASGECPNVWQVVVEVVPSGVAA